MNATTDQHIDNLRAMTTRAEAADYVANIKGVALNDLATAAHANRGTVDDKRAAIVHRYVGNRLNAAAIRAL